jgi:hypothetical protein
MELHYSTWQLTGYHPIYGNRIGALAATLEETPNLICSMIYAVSHPTLIKYSFLVNFYQLGKLGSKPKRA